jgi:hypothetical protein
VDLILTDIRMPGEIDGGELARSVRGQIQNIKIVILSACIDTQQRLPVDATLIKPVRIKALLAKVRELLPPRPFETNARPAPPNKVSKRKAARSGAAFHDSFNVDPGASVPIAMSLVFTPPIVLVIGPLPVVAINAQLQFWPIIRPSLNVPAVAVVIAYDGG